jgi:hypothetical protein
LRNLINKAIDIAYSPAPAPFHLIFQWFWLSDSFERIVLNRL